MIGNFISITRSGGTVEPKYLPMVEFSGVPTSLPEGSSVDYTDLSTVDPLGPPITQWQWTFEGGNPPESTAQNPTNITYATEGTYDVTLTATNADGSSTLTKTDYITVNVLPPSETINSWANQTYRTQPVSSGSVKYNLTVL